MRCDPAQILHDQTDRLVTLGYPALAGLDEQAFRDGVTPLAQVAAGLQVGSTATTPRVTSAARRVA